MRSLQSSEHGSSITGKTADVICDLVTNGSIEASTIEVERIAAASSSLPFGTSVYVPSPAARPLESNLPAVEALHAAGMEPVPHIAARKVRSRKGLLAYLARTASEFGVHRVLVIGGDAREAAGPYADSLALLQDDVLAEAGINEIGIAGYPEGHPRIPPDILRKDLGDKLQMAAGLDLGIEVITQFSFAPSRIVEYCAELAQRAPGVPVYVGMAGPTSMAKLIRYADYCGVSTSMRALSDMGVQAVDLVRHTEPDDQLNALAHHCALRDECNIIGVHVYSFGGFERSAQWLRSRCRGGGLEKF